MTTVTKKIAIRRGAHGRQEIVAPDTEKPSVKPGRIPRISKLMALAIQFDDMIRQGVVRDMSELATLCHVTQPRISQIMGLLQLSPAIQEELLFLPRVVDGEDPVTEKELRAVVKEVDWGKQQT